MEGLKLKKLMLFLMIASIVLFASISVCSCSYDEKDNRELVARNIIAEKIDNDAYLNSLDSYEENITDTNYSIVAVKTFDSSIFDEIDNVALKSEDTEIKATYSVDYALEENIVKLNCVFKVNEEIVEVDTIIGSTFYNENGEIDAVFVLDGEEFLLSELLSNINVCGWFTKALKFVAKAVCVTAAVAAVVALAPVAVTAMTTAGVAVVVGTTTVGAVVGVSAGAAALVACAAGAVYLAADTAEKYNCSVKSLGLNVSLVEYTDAIKMQIQKQPDNIYVAVPVGKKIFISPFTITETGAIQLLRAGTSYATTGIYTFDSHKAWQLAFDADGALPRGYNHNIAFSFKDAADYHIIVNGVYFKHFHPHYHSNSHSYFGLPL